jgi:hypothetical protein
MSKWSRLLGAGVGAAMFALGVLLFEGVRLRDVLGVGSGVALIVGGLLVAGGSLVYERLHWRRRDHS